MKNKNISKILLLLLLCWGSSLAWGGSLVEKATLSTDEHYPVQVMTRDTKRHPVELTFPNKPQRAIAYHQNNIETFIKLGELESLVATQGRYVANTAEEQLQQEQLLPKLHYHGQHGINQELAIYLEPDFIVGWASTFSRSVWGLGETEFWRQRGVNCYITSQLQPRGTAETLLGELKYVRDMGAIFNKEAVTNAYIQEIESYIAQAKKLTAGKPKQRVLILDLYGNYVGTYQANRAVGDMITQLGGQVVNISRWASREEVLMADPDVIFLIYKTNEAATVTDDFMEDRIYQGLQAVQNKRVYAVPLTYILNSGWRIRDGVRIVAQGLYPQLQLE